MKSLQTPDFDLQTPDDSPQMPDFSPQMPDFGRISEISGGAAFARSLGEAHSPPQWGRKETLEMNNSPAEAMIEILLKHCDSLEIGALRHVGRPGEKMLSHIWSPEKNLLAWAAFENSKNEANIFIRPTPETAHPWLFLDDLSFKKANALSEKYQCLVVETSPSNFQARLLASRNLALSERFEVQRVLAQKIGGDPGSTAGCKFGRLAGFKNRKPGKDFWTNLAAIPDESLPKFNPDSVLNISPPSGGGCASFPSAMSVRSGAGNSQSELEFGHIINRLRFFKGKGWDYMAESRKLEAALAESSRDRKKNPEQYAKKTIENALKQI